MGTAVVDAAVATADCALVAAGAVDAMAVPPAGDFGLVIAARTRSPMITRIACVRFERAFHQVMPETQLPASAVVGVNSKRQKRQIFAAA